MFKFSSGKGLKKGLKCRILCLMLYFSSRLTLFKQENTKRVNKNKELRRKLRRCSRAQSLLGAWSKQAYVTEERERDRVIHLSPSFRVTKTRRLFRLLNFSHSEPLTPGGRGGARA